MDFKGVLVQVTLALASNAVGSEAQHVPVDVPALHKGTQTMQQQEVKRSFLAQQQRSKNKNFNCQQPRKFNQHFRGMGKITSRHARRKAQ